MTEFNPETDFTSCITSQPAILMEGALGERLKREFHLKTDGPVALAGLICQPEGRAALETLWKEYIGIARKYHLPFLATTPTRRANRERITAGGYDESIIAQNVRLLLELKASSGIRMYAGGLMGCKGDAYTGEGSLSTRQAEQFHSWQATLFKEAGVDFLYAGIMPVLSEAAGMAKAMAATGLPYIISFTIGKDGKLIDGHTIDYAIRYIDSRVNPLPAGYMTNCVHPDNVRSALSHRFNRTEAVRKRFIGIQANASPLSHSELDGNGELMSSLPADLAESVLKLKTEHHFKIFGGCCGTDRRHIEEIARRLTATTEQI